MDKIEIVEKKQDFLPVILGTDWNVYGVASSFHEMYGINSVAFGMRRQVYTEHLAFLKVDVFEGFETSEVFVKVLVDFAKQNPNKRLLLIPCSDYYSSLVIDNAKILHNFYLFETIEPSLRNQLENKMSFYKTCEKHHLTYPKTFYVNRENYQTFDLPFDFPVAAKPSDSIKWFQVKFDGYKKAYVFDNMKDLKVMLQKAYTNGYDDVFVIQDFIPGDGDAMFVVNAYVNREGKVWMTHGAQTALDEVLPHNIGNYNALISGSFPELTQSVKQFLESISYRGFANFDFKYDWRDGTYKVFEINLRLGRSSYYMTVSGNNFAQYFVDDLIYQKDREYVDFANNYLWYVTSKKVLQDYCAPSLKETVFDLLQQKKAKYHLSYYANKNFYRWLLAWRRKISTIKYYPKYVEGK